MGGFLLRVMPVILFPPTGAKGLNLAFSDVYYLSRGFITFFKDKNEQLLKEYSDRALDRIGNLSDLAGG